jgi:hypothetical protein
MELDVVLTPYPDGDSVGKLEVRLAARGLAGKVGEPLLYFNTETVGIPCCPPQHLHIEDEAGELEMQTARRERYPMISTDYLPKRDVRGALEVFYTVVPRVVPATYRSSPYFDFRAEPGGANGPGKAFLPNLPGFDGEMALRWDLTHMPETCRAACAWGEGDVRVKGDTAQLDNAYFAVGDLRAVTDGEFGFYWFGQPGFDLEQVADFTKTLFGHMQKVFMDDRDNYRIFARRNPFVGGGGTALFRSYLFGYGTEGTDAEKLKNLLAHEMVHNWPHVDDSTVYGSGTWYNEGTAEYYSVLLPHRCGLMDAEAARGQLQKRLDEYYVNPYHTWGNVEAARRNWSDRRAQRMAYGRGILYVAHVDGAVRRATGGRKSLDDVVRQLALLHRTGHEPTNEDFLDAVKAQSGLDFGEDLDFMAKGGHLAPDPDAFDGLFRFEEKWMAEEETGCTVTGYRAALK